MTVSYNEFHIGKRVRDLCQFDGKLFTSSGNVVIKDLKNVKIYPINDIEEERKQQYKFYI